MAEPLYLWMAFDAVLTDPPRLLALLAELDSAGLSLNRIDDVEPVRKPYSEATVRELLTVPPVTRALPCRNLIGRGDRAELGIRACVPVEQDRGSVNVVDITVNRPTQQDMSLLSGFFDGDFFARHDVAYAFLDTWPEYAKQHVAGTINQRLPGVFWLNWLSRRYVEAIGDDIVVGLPWFKTAHVSDGLACWLYERLDAVPEDRIERVAHFEAALGREKFAKNGWKNLPQLARGTYPSSPSQPSDEPVLPQPTEELSDQMRADAETCQRLANQSGFGLNGNLDSLANLEELIDSLTPWSQASNELRQAMTRVIGAYFGEMIRNALGGSWLFDEQYQTPALQITRSLRIFPHSRIQKRWEEGKARSMPMFVDWLTDRVNAASE